MTLCSDRRVIVFAKQPLPGYAKSRLGRALGDEQAAGVYARLLYSYLHDLTELDLRDTGVELSLAEVEDIPYFIDAFPEFLVRSQVAGNLGDRLAGAFEQAFSEGARKVVLTGSDVPDLDHKVVEQALDALEESPVVLGPSNDGGYYLIGLQEPADSLFRGIDWSTDIVLEQTLQKVEQAGFSTVFLDVLDDIDNVVAYRRWSERLRVERSEGEFTKR